MKTESVTIGVIIATVVLIIAAIALFYTVFSDPHVFKLYPQTHIESITVVDKWMGNSFGYITITNGSVYRVNGELTYAKMRINHTYNAEFDTFSWKFPVIIDVKNEVFQ